MIMLKYQELQSYFRINLRCPDPSQLSQQAKMKNCAINGQMLHGLKHACINHTAHTGAFAVRCFYHLTCVIMSEKQFNAFVSTKICDNMS